MLRLVTDRTEADVIRLKALRAKIYAVGWAALTDNEKNAWLYGSSYQELFGSDGEQLFDINGEALIATGGDGTQRGAYNYVDFNRVGEAIQYLAGLLNANGYYVAVSARTDWAVGDKPRTSAAAAYLADVAAIKAIFYGTTPLPPSMNKLTYVGANNIEALLWEVERYLNLMVAGRRKCGTFRCGQGVILP